jgi:hypothetical protein
MELVEKENKANEAVVIIMPVLLYHLPGLIGILFTIDCSKE